MKNLVKKIAAVHKQNSDYSARGETPKPLATVFTYEHERIVMRMFGASLLLLAFFSGALAYKILWTAVLL